MSFDDIGYGILAQAHLAPDQAIAASDRDERHHLRRETVGFRPLPGLTAQALAACLCGSDAGADALLDELPFEVRNAGNDGRHTEQRALTPLFWGHVNLYGTFRLDMTARLPLDLPTPDAAPDQFLLQRRLMFRTQPLLCTWWGSVVICSTIHAKPLGGMSASSR